MVQPWHVGINCSLIIKLSYNTKPHHIYMFTHLSLHKQSNVQRTNNSIKRRNYKITLKYINQWYYFKQISWVKNGRNHRFGAPADILYFRDGDVSYIKWYKNGRLHRINAPACINYFENEQIQSEEWFKNGERYRVGGAPVYISYFENGQVEKQY